jgi:hypothetical protein
MFDELGSLDLYTDSFILLENEHTEGHQIFNVDGSYSSTKNIKDLTVVPIGNNQLAYLDSEKIPDYLSYDSKITQTSVTGYSIAMDQVRFHFVSGFDFDDFKALALSVKNTERDGKTNLFANILLAPETSAELITYNPKPLFLGNAMYDRYIDIMVPSIKNINDEYDTSLAPGSTFVAAITPTAASQSAFITNSQISIGLSECGRRDTLYTNINQTFDVFEVTEYVEAQLSQTNEFDTVGAYVNESTAGDFIEFYLTFNSGFPADLLAILNSRNPSDDWIIIHQISVFEQVGTAFFNTSRFVFFQEDRFDEPNVFRPVLKNANEAVSMAVDYLARLTNRRNGDQIIREASFSLVSPKKYGTKLITLPLLDKPQSQKIYNKLIKKSFESTKLFIEPTLNETIVNTTTQVTTVTKIEYVPIFFNNNSISVSNSSGLLKQTDSTEEIIFGPGKLRFILSPFDNVIKLKVFTTNTSSSKTTQIPLDLNVNSAKYRLVFETASSKVGIDNSNDPNIENLSTGVMAFIVSKKDSETIFQSSTRTVYLVAVSQDGKETLIYSGEWRKPTEQSEVDAAITAANEEANTAASVQTTLTEIQASVNAAADTAANAVVSINKPIKSIAVTSVVNQFGVAKPKAIRPDATNAGKSK